VSRFLLLETCTGNEILRLSTACTINWIVFRYVTFNNDYINTCFKMADSPEAKRWRLQPQPRTERCFSSGPKPPGNNPSWRSSSVGLHRSAVGNHSVRVEISLFCWSCFVGSLRRVKNDDNNVLVISIFH